VFCTGHFVMVPINSTCPHCLQHFFFEHLFHIYLFYRLAFFHVQQIHSSLKPSCQIDIWNIKLTRNTSHDQKWSPFNVSIFFDTDKIGHDRSRCSYTCNCMYKIVHVFSLMLYMYDQFSFEQASQLWTKGSRAASWNRG